MSRAISSTWVTVLTAIYFTSVLNISFWRFVLERQNFSTAGEIVFALSLPVVLFLLFLIIFSVLLVPYAGKILLGLLFIGSAAASYFMFRLNVIISSEMMRNVFESKPHEAFEMITPEGIAWVLLFGALPAALLALAKIQYRPWRREMAARGLRILASLVILLVLAVFLYKDYAAVGRNNRDAGRFINPVNYIASTRSYFRQRARQDMPFVVIDRDPEHIPYEDPHFTVLVLMIGETARAMNFSLNGYERETNPKLSGQDIVNFPNVTASGTATAFSLPCMFSHLPRERFDIDASYKTENLLDVMIKAGYDVLWLDNDGGSKGVADRATTIDLMKDGNPEFRNGDTFFDEVLLDGLEERLKNITGNTVLVLHMMGSHGPSYHLRYPERFRVFTPAADTAEIQSLPREEIVNTYDNTILYTDHVVSEAIDILARFPRHEAGLLYVSDHGESLGESGLYLHGMPYAIAPKEQTRVPMLLWMSETMRRYDHVDYARLKAAAPELELSHDNLFHSVLGLVEIDTELYDPALDLFRAFRTKELPRR